MELNAWLTNDWLIKRTIYLKLVSKAYIEFHMEIIKQTLDKELFSSAMGSDIRSSSF